MTDTADTLRAAADRLRDLDSAACPDVWKLGDGWTQHVTAALPGPIGQLLAVCTSDVVTWMAATLDAARFAIEYGAHQGHGARASDDPCAVMLCPVPTAVRLAEEILRTIPAPDATETGREGGVERLDTRSTDAETPGGERGPETAAERLHRQHRHALVFNAISAALRDTPDDVPFSVRKRATGAALAEVDEWNEGAPATASVHATLGGLLDVLNGVTRAAVEVVTNPASQADFTLAPAPPSPLRDRIAEAAIARVRAECDAIVREVHGQHDEDCDGMREAVRRVRAVLDGGEQP